MHIFSSKHADFQHLEAVGFMKALSLNLLEKDLPSCVHFKLLRTLGSVQWLEYNSDAMTIFSKMGNNIVQKLLCHISWKKILFEAIVHSNHVSANYYKPCFVVLSLYRKNA